VVHGSEALHTKRDRLSTVTDFMVKLLNRRRILDLTMAAIAVPLLLLLRAAGSAYGFAPAARTRSTMIQKHPGRSISGTVIPLLPRQLSSSRTDTASSDANNNHAQPSSSSPPLCLYKNASTRNQWRPRIELSKLRVGQELKAVVVQEKIKGAVTGPKVWVDAGVGRYRDNKKNWKIVNGMLRLGHRNTKESVARKKATKLRNQSAGFSVFVSHLRLEQDQFEVVLQREQLLLDADEQQQQQPLQSSSKLQPGTEVKGTVVRVEPYGCIVDLDGYNRPGLLHIQRVADLYGTYIDKAAGLEEYGLERKSRVKLCVLSNEKKRLFLDFTSDVKQEAENERIEEEKRQQQRGVVVVSSPTTSASDDSSGSASSEQMSAEELARWNAYYDEDSGEGDVEDDEEEEEYDGYDEERDIEDALGLGSY